jgi:hypothetical protein
MYDYFLGDIEPGNWADYRVNMAYDGTYDLYLDVATVDTAVGQVEILVDGEQAWPNGAYVQIPDTTGSWYAFKNTELTTVQVAKNFHTIRLVARSNPGKHFNINKFHLGRIPPQ